MKKHHIRLAHAILMILLTALIAGCGTQNMVDPSDDPTDTDINQIPSDIVPSDEAIVGNVSMEEKILVDNDNITVIVKDYDPNGDLGPTFTLFLQNKTDSTLYFTMGDVSVNDVMADPLWGETVSANTSVSSGLHWFPQALAAVGINYIEEVEGVLWVYDGDDYTNDDIYEELVTWNVTNHGMDVPPVEEVVFTGGIEDIILCSEEHIQAVIKDFSFEREWGPALTIYLENNTDSSVLFYMNSVYINDIALDSYWNEDVGAGKSAYSQCYWWWEDLEENQIDEIRTVTFTFSVIDYNTWSHLTDMAMTISLEGEGEVLSRIDFGSLSQ